jgi:hypothetical protein
MLSYDTMLIDGVEWTSRCWALNLSPCKLFREMALRLPLNVVELSSLRKRKPSRSSHPTTPYVL